jgi:hypothetical protein
MFFKGLATTLLTFPMGVHRLSSSGNGVDPTSVKAAEIYKKKNPKLIFIMVCRMRGARVG